jgi:hypothetical protein
VSSLIESRLADLRGELRKGREELVALERRRSEVRDTVLRISGAIQVLEELREADAGAAGRVTVLTR